MISSGGDDAKFQAAVGRAAAALLLAEAPAVRAEPPEKAKIDWKQFQGTSLDLFFVKHPWTSAIEPLLPEFEKLTGIKLNLTTAAEDAFWNKSSLGLASTKPPFDVFFLSMGINGYTAYSNDWLAELNEPARQSQADRCRLVSVWRLLACGGARPSICPTRAARRSTASRCRPKSTCSSTARTFSQKSGIDPDSIKTMDEWMAALNKLKLPDGIYAASIRGGGLGILDELNGMVID